MALLGVHRGWFIGRVDYLSCCYMDERLDDASFALYLKMLAEDIDTVADGETRSILYDVPGQPLMTADRRKRAAAVLATRRAKLGVINHGLAFCTPSTVSRGVITAVNWLFPPPYPATTMSTVADGIRWLSRRDPRIDVTTASRQYDEMKQTALARMKAL